MRKILMPLIFLTSIITQYGCDRRAYDSEDIERQEEMETKDVRDVNQGEVLDSDDEVELDRDVLGDDEIEIND